jgi:hypothetical protein
MATHDAAILVASFRGFQGVTDLHHKLSGKMLKEMARYAGRTPQCQPGAVDFGVMKTSFAFALIPLLKAKPAANAVDSPRSREIL